MKILKPFVAFALMLCFLVSCESKFYKKYQDIPMLQWKRENVLKYEVQIDNIAKAYDLTIALRFVPSIKQHPLNLLVGTVSPTGKTTQKTYAINIKGAEGQHIGKLMGDIADLEQKIEGKYMFLEKGKYTFTITQATDAADLGGVQEVGLVIDQEKTK